MPSKPYLPIERPMTPSSIRAGIETLIEYWQEAQQGNPPASALASYAVVLVSTIVEELLAPYAGQIDLVAPSEEIESLSVERQRELLATSLRRGVLLLYRPLAAEFADALESLNAGPSTARLLRPSAEGRGADPYQIALAKLDFSKWIRLQHGRGRKVGEAEADVAAAAGCTVAAVRIWPRDIERSLGRERVKSELSLAEEIGRREAKGLTRRDCDNYELMRAWLLLRRDLAEIAERFEGAREARLRAKTRNK